MRHTILFLLAFPISLAGQNQPLGRVFSESNKPIDNALIVNLRTEKHCHTNAKGEFMLGEFQTGDSVQISHLNFETETVRLVENHFDQGIFIRLFEKIFSFEDIIIEQRPNAMKVVSQIDLQTNPVNSSQEILRKVPGLFIAQHAGGGKAEQIFLRGFDIDHGTDVAIDVDGLPVNMVSHAHGQGYADLHFLIPETVEEVDFGKGPYYANHGNFNTAGYVSFRTKDQLGKNSISAQIGQFNTARLLAMTNLLPKSDRHSAFVASEFQLSDGPFEAPQDFNRLNVMGKYVFTAKNFDRIEVMASHFQSQWDASGQIPQRAVDAGLITRFGAIDATEGGNTSRTNFSIQHQRQSSRNLFLKNQIYFTQYDFELFSNFTFFLEDPINSDQIRQYENRSLFGLLSEVDYQWENVLWKAGIGLRHDQTEGSELAHTANRKTTLEQFKLGDVEESNGFAFAQAEWALGKWTVNPGLRLDGFRFGYKNALDSAYSNENQQAAVVSPKLNFFFNPTQRIQYFLKTGIGFHSNDSRAVVETQAVRRALPRAFGSDLGMIWKPNKKLLLNTALWALFLEQEFVYVGDAGIVEPSGKTRRLGADLGLRYQLSKHLFADADATYTYARSTEEEAGEDYIPLAPDFTLAGGLSYQNPKGFTASLRFRHLKNRPANEDGSITALGYTVFDANANYSFGKFTVGVQVENLLNTEWNEAQFATESRLQKEAMSVEELHYTPGVPFFAKVRVGVDF